MKKYNFIFSIVVLSFVHGINSQEEVSNMPEKTEVTVIEDLMREHGLLRRILLIYEHCASCLEHKKTFDHHILKQAGTLIQTFIENYHEKLEEEYIFPKVRTLSTFNDTIDTLIEQHNAGRKLTRHILSLLNAPHSIHTNRKIAHALQDFIHMYRAHAAREDTIIFPAIHMILSAQDYHELGELFEKIETEKFGDHGFEHILRTVEHLEQSLGIYELKQYTPQLQG